MKKTFKFNQSSQFLLPENDDTDEDDDEIMQFINEYRNILQPSINKINENTSSNTLHQLLHFDLNKNISNDKKIPLHQYKPQNKIPLPLS